MPERRFSQSDIVDAAFRIVREQGWSKCSARAIAQVLGSSTMPIYSALKSMKNLEEEISRRASDILIGYQTRRWSGYGFLDMGVGYVMFAQEEKNLFRMMYFQEPGDLSDAEMRKRFRGYVFDTLMERLENEKIMEGLGTGQRRDVLYKMWLFSHGLAMLINNSIVEPMTEDQITRFLMDTGWLIITGERARNTGKPVSSTQDR